MQFFSFGLGLLAENYMQTQLKKLILTAKLMFLQHGEIQHYRITMHIFSKLVTFEVIKLTKRLKAASTNVSLPHQSNKAKPLKLDT